MTLRKSSRYALYAAIEMAKAGDEPVTVAQVAGPHGIPAAALAKVFQQLVRAGMAVGTRGIGGGYRLARPRGDITVLEVVSVFDPPRTPGADLLNARTNGQPATPQAAALRRLFDEVDEGIVATLASVTLDTLVR
ncbi:MAG TPA: Rrf2 family transcriptional regulator [Vicinamibacterales bacterium]|nr:Rrf2 family transcriptional regulator [Vicinamibacterales bacterium]